MRMRGKAEFPGRSDMETEIMDQVKPTTGRPPPPAECNVRRRAEASR